MRVLQINRMMSLILIRIKIEILCFYLVNQVRILLKFIYKDVRGEKEWKWVQKRTQATKKLIKMN